MKKKEWTNYVREFCFYTCYFISWNDNSNLLECDNEQSSTDKQDFSYNIVAVK